MMTASRKIEWAERDIGQKMSMVIGGTIYAAFVLATFFFAITETPYAEWAKLGLAFIFGMAVNELIQRWRQRNARR